MKNVMDIQKMLKSAQAMQDRLQKELAVLRVEGSSGGGMVTVVLDGHKALQSLRINPEVVNRDEVEMLQDLVVAAFNDAATKVEEALAQKLGGLGAGLKSGARLMFEYAQPLHDLIEELRHIPGIGAKTAQRIAFYFLGLPAEDTDRLAEAIREAKRRIFYCSRCNNITHVDPCLICSDDHRSDDTLCIVEEPFNISSIERTGAYNGRYHVLLGALSPLKGRGPDELRLGKLTKRIEEGAFQEIIIATNPTVEGEATALYLLRVLKDYGIRMTRLAMGLPVGSDLDFADQVTIKKALEGRTELKE